jgi:hypothetical protein
LPPWLLFVAVIATRKHVRLLLVYTTFRYAAVTLINRCPLRALFTAAVNQITGGRPFSGKHGETPGLYNEVLSCNIVENHLI